MSTSKCSPTTPIEHAQLVWALPCSLATTWGIICYFLFLWLLRCFSSPGWLCSVSLQRVIPLQGIRLSHSEIFGLNGCMHLPEAYRSLPRPSSPLSAKASAIRPYFALKILKSANNDLYKKNQCSFLIMVITLLLVFCFL